MNADLLVYQDGDPYPDVVEIPIDIYERHGETFEHLLQYTSKIAKDLWHEHLFGNNVCRMYYDAFDSLCEIDGTNHGM